MGNTFSKNKFGKVQDFSLPFMNPDYQKSADEWKAIEDEKNRALADKKRFAVRLSEVEEILSKKSDRIKELEFEIIDMGQSQKLLQGDMSLLSMENGILKKEKETLMMDLMEVRGEAELLRKELLACFSKSSSSKNSTHQTLPLASATDDTVLDITTDSVKTAEVSGNEPDRMILEKLVRQLEEKERVKVSMSTTLAKIQDDYLKLKSEMLLLEKTQSQTQPKSRISRSVNLTHSTDKSLSQITGQSADSLDSEGSIYYGMQSQN